MAAVLASDTVQTPDGAVVSETRWLDDGTVETYDGGKLVESRPQTADEAERFAPRPLSDAERLAIVEAQNAELLAKLAAVTTLAQVRAAAQAAAAD